MEQLGRLFSVGNPQSAEGCVISRQLQFLALFTVFLSQKLLMESQVHK